MGMAASQAKLLSLTNRLHDVEYKAQHIESQKIALATQKDELYKDYCEALDATTVKVAFWNGASGTSYIDANYSTLCTYNKERCKQYALKDNQTNNLIVSSEVKEAFDTYGNDKYVFAWAMIGMNQFNDGATGQDNTESGRAIGYKTGVRNTNDDYRDYDTYKAYTDPEDGSTLYMTQAEIAVFEAHKNGDDNELLLKFQAIQEAEGRSAKQEALNTFRDLLYSKYSTEIYDAMNLVKTEDGTTKETISDDVWADMKDQFNYYVNLWTAIKEAGGCQTIDPQYESGEDGTNWFNNMVEAGLLTIQVWDDTGSSNEWSDTNVATSTNNNYLQNMQDDTDLKKAEAEYEYELGIINDKDTEYDTELSKLETERTAITTEIESIQKVRDENTERTFGIFS